MVKLTNVFIWAMQAKDRDTLIEQSLTLIEQSFTLTDC